MEIKAKGIDVSYAQGKIDWEKVKADGVDFAIIRAGYGQYASQEDSCFKRNVQCAAEAGVPFGLYWYSYAKTPADAEKEAEVFLGVIKGLKPEYPVVLDIEDNSQANLPGKTLNGIVKAFCGKMEAAGYYAAVYSNLSWLKTKLGDIGEYDVWLAQWVAEPTYAKPFGMWQYTAKGKVAGIAGAVDRDYAYKDYPAMIRAAGLNGFEKSGPEPPVQCEPETPKKTLDELAREVIAGDWGNGEERKKRLEAAGYNYKEVQKRVNQLL